MNRRGFLQGMLLLAAAPAIVRADSLMRIIPLETTIERFAVNWADPRGLYGNSNMAKALWPGIQAWWLKTYNEHPDGNMYPFFEQITEEQFNALQADRTK